MLEPFDKGLMATRSHYAYEIRNAAEYFGDIAWIAIDWLSGRRRDTSALLP
jgi:non-homologous end joining protein Ku